MSGLRKIILGIFALLLVATGIGVLLLLRAPGIFPAPSRPAFDSGVEKKAGADTSSIVGGSLAAELGIPTKAPTDPRMAFLLLGYGGAGHDGPYLTDSIMLAVADPNQKTLTLLSIPRDAWAPLLFDGKSVVYNKVNTAFAFATDSSLYRGRLDRYKGKQGAGHFAEDTVARLLGVPIANYLGLDFQGFRSMIDTVGGIDVDVPDSFSARYPANDDPDLDASWTTVRFTKGSEHMSGERAIQFARARETISNQSEGTDFARARRQRIIIEAFKARVLSPGGLLHLPQLASIAAGHLNTDYTIPAAGQLGQFLVGWKDVRIFQTAITADNYLAEGTGPEGTYVLVPSMADRSWAQVRAFARRLWQDPAMGAAMANTKIVVVNDTGIAGLATRLSAALAKLGYRVGEPITGQMRASSRLVDRTGGKAGLVAAQLAADLGVHFQQVADAADPASGDLTLELGADDASAADVHVPEDEAAPSSATGIKVVGQGSPDAAAIPTATPQSTVQSAPTRTPTPRSPTPTTASPAATSSPHSSPSPTIPARTGTPVAGSATATSAASLATATPVAPSATATPAAGPATATPVAPSATATPTRASVATSRPSPSSTP